ncbi:MAG: hypothetical protein M0Z45_05535 [Actinomycetota bacterium]|nr:hypothetical protein [Actinomycetota bacterium]
MTKLRPRMIVSVAVSSNPASDTMEFVNYNRTSMGTCLRDKVVLEEDAASK